VIAIIALITACVGALMILALLCLLVYDPVKTAGLPIQQRIGFCLRQLGSWWPWR
jgi:hypothetical protein